MIRVYCFTNLDLANERWPGYLPSIPLVGDEIESATTHGEFRSFRLCLQVVAVRWQHSVSDDTWTPSVELHMTEWQKRRPSLSGRGEIGGIIAFYEWYAPLVGRSASSFIS
jgi:hypothetical protein